MIRSNDSLDAHVVAHPKETADSRLKWALRRMVYGIDELFLDGHFTRMRVENKINTVFHAPTYETDKQLHDAIIQAVHQLRPKFTKIAYVKPTRSPEPREQNKPEPSPVFRIYSHHGYTSQAESQYWPITEGITGKALDAEDVLVVPALKESPDHVLAQGEEVLQAAIATRLVRYDPRKRSLAPSAVLYAETPKQLSKLDVHIFRAIANVLNVNYEGADAALYDKAITGFFQRAVFDNDLRDAVAQARQNGTLLSIITFDLNNFKQINDTHGHGAGDLYLSAIAESILNTTRDENHVYRTGGDEGALILKNTPLSKAYIVKDHLMKATDKAMDDMRKAYNWENNATHALSAGVAEYHVLAQRLVESKKITGELDPETFVKYADGEMYKEKRKDKRNSS